MLFDIVTQLPLGVMMWERTSDADILADGLKVAHDPRRGSEVVHRQRPGLRTKRQTDRKSGAAGDAALRLSTRIVPDPERRVASHERLDELAEVLSVVELDGDEVPRLFHGVITCTTSDGDNRNAEVLSE